MTTRTASCACGQLTATATGEPARISLCHCDACKRRSGSAFALQATWPEDCVVIRGVASVYERIGQESGRWLRDSFCATCGGHVFYRIEFRPDMISIPVGAFADPDFPPPTVEVYGEKAQAGIGKQLGKAAQE